jgi:hypothetical protein
MKLWSQLNRKVMIRIEPVIIDLLYLIYQVE